MKTLILVAALIATVVGAGAVAQAQEGHPHSMAASEGDGREPVRFPAEMRRHMLANMRDHLLALKQIQEALAEGAYDRAGDLAERRLGMSSLEAHGAQHMAPFMPKGMQEIGTAMHRSASRFALAAQEAAVSGDVRGALGALANVTSNCVACHFAYRAEQE